ncbi:MAG TPA: helix-turn-helix domain-containing protein [Caldilineaceae bacterium]|nr:helix-turn-helix domain-containing protein [Caldilineaceae bacterium]
MEKKPGLNVERLNEMMERRGWGPGELAYQSGVGYDTIYKIRSAKRPRTSAEILAQLAQALGCSVDYLVGLTDSPVPYGKQSLSPLQQALMVEIGKLSPRRQRDLWQIVAGLLRADAEDRASLERDLRVNRQLREAVERLGGEQALQELFEWLGFSPPALAGERSDPQPRRAGALPSGEEPDEEEEDG